MLIIIHLGRDFDKEVFQIDLATKEVILKKTMKLAGIISIFVITMQRYGVG